MIVIFDGADFSGKTTGCNNLKEEILSQDPRAKVAMIHFPIRDLDKDVKLFNTLIQPNIFHVCPALNGTMLNIQDVIATHMENNTWMIKSLSDIGFTVILDRFIISNIVYRSIHCDQKLTVKDYSHRFPESAILYNLAHKNILVVPVTELMRRRDERYDIEMPTHSLDLSNEKKENLRKAVKLFSLFAGKE